MVKEIVFLIDKSGSMGGSEDRVVKGYNELLQEQKAEPGTLLLTTILFDHNATTLHERVGIQDVAALRPQDYVPTGSTALLDAVGDATTAILENDASVGGLLFIMTDGYENSSQRFSFAKVKQLLKGIQEKGWDVQYIGADLSNFADAERMGIHRDQHIPTVKASLFSTMKSISSGIKEFRKGQTVVVQGTMKRRLFDRTLPYLTTAQGWSLIDTGSPISFGDIDAFVLDSQRHFVLRNPLIVESRRHLGRDVSAVIGMDILGHYNLRVDYTPNTGEYKLCHDPTPQLWMEQSIPLRYLMGIPVVEAAVNGEIVPMFVDTCSDYTYIDKAHSRGARVGKVHDFYPGLGTFDSPTYRTELSLCGRSFTISAATLPSVLEPLLSVSGVKGIIGLDVLKQQRTVLAFRLGVLGFGAVGPSCN